MTMLEHRSPGLLGVLEQFGNQHDPWLVDGEALYPTGTEPPLEVVQRRESSWVVLLMKDALLRWHAERLEGLSATVITSSFPVCNAVADELRGHVDSAGRTIAIVGDLDPHALCQYCALTRCNLFGVPLFSDAGWMGVDDMWLTLLQRYSDDWTKAVFDMTAAEKRLLGELDHEVDLDAIVGSASASLLRAGRKLELEGACNPELYGEGFADALFRHLLARMESKEGQTK